MGLWPHLWERGLFFIDEYVRLDYCALFFSERYWRTYFDRPPPGLMGAGTGVPVGQHFVGPERAAGPLESPSSVGWTRKDFYGAWDYFPDDAPAEPLPGGPGSTHGPEGWTTTTVSTEERTEGHLARMLEQDPAAPERLAARLASEEGREALAAKLVSTAEGREALAAALAEAEPAPPSDT